MKQARIECPHCGGNITIRQKSADDLNPAAAAKIWEAVDETLKAMDAGFRKIFHPSLWR